MNGFTLSPTWIIGFVTLFIFFLVFLGRFGVPQTERWHHGSLRCPYCAKTIKIKRELDTLSVALHLLEEFRTREELRNPPPDLEDPEPTEEFSLRVIK